MDIIDIMTKMFLRFPGIGSRQARRFVYFLLSQDKQFLDELSKNIGALKKSVDQCSSCYRFFKKRSENPLCDVCLDPNADPRFLLVVEKDVDFENVRKTGAYSGKYFILGGIIPILDEEPSKRIRMRELLSIVEKRAKEGLEEVIFALSANEEGENTALYVKKTLEDITQKFKIKTSVLGRGLSTGAELEYSDQDTLSSALKNRS